jgi:antitoxin (DNA-binding transcriptional repressor) of toxin-antitoxin stability system
MTLAQSDLSELLDAIRAGGDVDVIREAVACPYLVAGGCHRSAASDLRGAKPAGSRACIGQCIRSCLLNRASATSRVPRNPT